MIGIKNLITEKDENDFVVVVKTTSKKIKLVPISDSAYYPGQDMRWTERMDDPITIKSDITAYHYSCDKIKAFLSKETCFFDEFRHNSGYIYQILIPAGSVVTYCATGEEIRVDLGQKNIKIYLVGEIEREKTDRKRKDGFGGFVPLMKNIVKIYK